MSVELFIGSLDLSPYVVCRSISGAQFVIHNMLLKDVPKGLQEDLYLLLDAFNAEHGLEWEKRLRLYTNKLNFAIARWEYQDFGPLSDLRLYMGFECRVKLTLDRGLWYRVRSNHGK